MEDILKMILEQLKDVDFGNSHTIFGIVFSFVVAGLLRTLERRKLNDKIISAGGTPSPGFFKSIVNLFKKK